MVHQALHNLCNTAWPRSDVTAVDADSRDCGTFDLARTDKIQLRRAVEKGAYRLPALAVKTCAESHDTPASRAESKANDLLVRFVT